MSEAFDVQRALEANDIAVIERHYSPSMRLEFPVGSLVKRFAALAQERGKLTTCKDLSRGLYRCTVAKPPTIDVRVTWNTAGEIAGFSVSDSAPPIADPPFAKTRLRPPFSGAWTAHDANLDPGSAHFSNPQQRYAVDWVITDKRGATARNGTKRLTSYYAYGKPALAVAAGRVAMVIDGVPDNHLPAERDPHSAGGNQVAIEIGPDEYAYYAHLQPGSIRVKVGDRVKAGRPIGLVGNSGDSNEPHLHFQISTKPLLHQGRSLPAFFSDVLIDGRRAERARPLTNQRLEYREKR